MASSNLIAEFSRKPPIVKVGVFAGIAVLLGLAYYQLVLSGIREETTQAEQARAALIAEDGAVKKQEREYQDLKQQHAELEKTIDDNDDALPTAAQLPAFFDMLNRKVGEASVEVRRWEYQKEIPVDDFIKVPVVVEIQGTFQEVKKFFYLLYKMSQKEGEEIGAEPAPGSPSPALVGGDDRDRILTIEDLKISDPVVKNNDLLLTARFRVSTFRQESPEPEVDEAAKKPAAKPAAARNPPAAAKQKVDAAMDSSETRAGGAPAGGADAVKKGM